MSYFVADSKIQYRNNDKIGKIKDLVTDCRSCHLWNGLFCLMRFK